jgi:hypothetical protein
MSQLLEHLPSKWEALSLNPTAAKKKLQDTLWICTIFMGQFKNY